MMRTNAMIPLPLQEKVDRELESGERIEWMDMPIPRFFTAGSTGAFLFGIPWTAFALFWTAGAAWGVSQDESGWGLGSLFPLFGLPFILIGIGMLSSPIWVYRNSFKTVYVITDRRAITFVGGWTTTIRSYGPKQLVNVYRKEKRDGSGDVIFAGRVWYDSENDRHIENQGFLRIQNPKEVERMLRVLAEQAE